MRLPSERRVWSRTAAGHYHTASSTGALVPGDDGAQESQPAAALWLACPDPLQGTTSSAIQSAAQAPSCQQIDGAQAGQHSLPPATAQPTLVQHWDITRPWHPRTGKRQQPGAQEQEEDALVPPAAAATLNLFGLKGSQILDWLPQAWELGLTASVFVHFLHQRACLKIPPGFESRSTTGRIAKHAAGHRRSERARLSAHGLVAAAAAAAAAGAGANDTQALQD
ncbi:hypothetical protein COCSUDRAFT_59732 [Coccomyxa subellipsoidea C-169]|uniref:Uncharacterized protein n=1 Tax=Coccomyxa subellipsoidea (strain C-169) TaxID=574566 RepID=I0YLH2_COCSC|nr:hypothetical protein COCSUDRAFT_59732 [Coccomyxa subellipsoidea C-169]EIE19241.1 hypothetical protein COCSUDRAFT_59732 [Coccomyxa subellipsoidea C-169]|eukprot:XP_005643785.1 hypothetical protein COCSUDRAFT_59732 [Coccomyxa subellipsoidea C-169]